MSARKSGHAWLLAAVIATALVLRPSEARASDTAEVAPFMIMAAVFTVTIIVIAINNPTDSDSEASSSSTDTGTGDQALRFAPVQEGPRRPAPIVGFSGRF